MKAKKSTPATEVKNVTDPKANYRAVLAKALGKPVSEVKPVEVPEDKPERTIVQPTRFGHNPFAAALKEQKNVAEVIAAEVKKSKIKPLKDSDVVEEDRLDDGTIIEIVEVDCSGNRIKPTSKAPVRTSPKEMARLQGEKEEIAAAKKALNKIKKDNPISALLNKSVKDTPKSKKQASKPSVSKAEHKPFSKMTLDELIEIKGTGIISDGQWIKYARPLGYSNGGVNVSKTVTKATKATKAVDTTPIKKSLKDMTAAERKEYYNALSAKALAAKRAKAGQPDAPTTSFTRKPVAAPVKATELDEPVKIAMPKPIKAAPASKLADVPLDDLIAELKRRGCKGTISVCAEFEL